MWRLTVSDAFSIKCMLPHALAASLNSCSPARHYVLSMHVQSSIHQKALFLWLVPL